MRAIIIFLQSISLLIVLLCLTGNLQQINRIARKLKELELEAERLRQLCDRCSQALLDTRKGFRQVREAVIAKGLLSQEFRYLDEEEPLEEFVDDFLNS